MGQRISKAMLVSVSALLLCIAAATATPRFANCSDPRAGGNDQDWINAAFAAGASVVELCPGRTYDLASVVRFAAPNQELRTYGLPSGNLRAYLLVRSADGMAIFGQNLTGIKLRNLRIDAGGTGSAGGAALIEIGGSASDQVVDQVQASHPRGWTALHVWQGADLSCKRATITNNTIGPSGIGYPVLGQWADGISLACADSVVSNNTVEGASDGGIVIFGSPGSHITGNTIRATNQVLFGGINLVDYGPWSGNFTGVVVENNRIEAAGAQIQIAIGMGYRVWWCDSTNPISRGAVVQGNVLAGPYMWYGYAVSGVSGWTVMANTSVASHSGEPIDCSGNATSPRPSAFLKDSSNSSGSFQGDFQEAALHGLVEHLGPPVPMTLQPTNGSSLSAEQTSVNLSWAAAAGISSFQIVVSDTTDPAARDPRNNCNQNAYLCLTGWASKSVSLPVKSGHSYSWTVRGVYSPADRPAPLLGSLASASFGVQAATDAAAFVTWGPPPSCMWPGSTTSVSVTMKNTGTTTWNSSYRLGSQNPQDNLTWGVGRVFLAPGETVAPQKSKTFSFSVTAPSSPGTFYFQWRMVHEAVRWFGDYTPNTAVTNTAPSAPSGLSPNGVSLPAGSTSVTLSWSLTPMATRYAVRLRDDTNGSLRSTWSCPGSPTIYLCVNDIAANSYIATVFPGHSYTWWVHAGDCVAYSAPTYGSFSVPVEALHAPTNLRFEGFPSRNVLWSPPDNLTPSDQVRYDLWLYGPSCPSGCEFTAAAPSWYTIGPSIGGGTYTWKLRAISVSRSYSGFVNGPAFVLGP